MTDPKHGTTPEESPELERKPLQDAFDRPYDAHENRHWRGPKGTHVEAWIVELRGISEAIQARENAKAMMPSYTSPPGVQWRLDCLADLLTLLEHNRRHL